MDQSALYQGFYSNRALLFRNFWSDATAKFEVHPDKDMHNAHEEQSAVFNRDSCDHETNAANGSWGGWGEESRMDNSNTDATHCHTTGSGERTNWGTSQFAQSDQQIWPDLKYITSIQLAQIVSFGSRDG